MKHTNNKEPDTSLGKITIEIDLDSGKYNLNVENETTGQLTNPEEVLNLLSATGVKLLVEAIRSRSKRIVVV